MYAAPVLVARLGRTCGGASPVMDGVGVGEGLGLRDTHADSGGVGVGEMVVVGLLWVVLWVVLVSGME